MKKLKLPGLIDIHVHLREPGATQKEDFTTGTRAAVAGGVTYVLDMPNNPISTITYPRLEQKIKLAKKKALCGVGFYFGTNGKNLAEFPKAYTNRHVFGLKLYCNHTTGEMLIEDLQLLENVFEFWKSHKPILVHAEGVQLAAVIGLAHVYGRRLHVCHISQKEEVEVVKRAKKKGMKITAGVTPHHLFLTQTDVRKLGAYAMMKPPIGTSADQKALWQGIKEGTIDVVETDHAPHTRQEKDSDKPPFGVPGLETMLPLLLNEMFKGKLTQRQLLDLLYNQPRKIFNIPEQADTYIEVSDQSWRVGEDGYVSKCGWSPFAGWKVRGRVEKVVLEGRIMVEGGKLIKDKF